MRSETVGGDGKGYIPWAPNVQPIVDSWMENKKYERNQADTQRNMFMQTAINKGLIGMQPEQEGTYGTFDWQGRTPQEQMLASGKTPGTMYTMPDGTTLPIGDAKTLMAMVKMEEDRQSREDYKINNPNRMSLGMNSGGVMDMPAPPAKEPTIFERMRGVMNPVQAGAQAQQGQGQGQGQHSPEVQQLLKRAQASYKRNPDPRKKQMAQSMLQQAMKLNESQPAGKQLTKDEILRRVLLHMEGME